VIDYVKWDRFKRWCKEQWPMWTPSRESVELWEKWKMKGEENNEAGRD